MENTMKLYDGGRAPNPRRVRIFLAEKGIDVPLVHVDMATRQHVSDEIRKLNPLGELPFLELDDGTIITETMAICRYFEALHPSPALFGASAVEIGIVEMWQRRVELKLFASIAAAFRHIHPAMAYSEVPQVPEWGEANKPKALAAMAMLDGQLAANEFICGSQISVADITAMIAIDFTKPAKIAVPDELEHLRRWYAAMKTRPSALANP
jgi:glutathione S-transferase